MSKVFEVAFKLGAELTSSFKKAFGEANGTIKLFGGAVAALGGTAALGSLMSQVGEMNEALTQLSAQTGLVGEDFEELKGVAENLFRNNYGDSFDEVTKALAQVKQNIHGIDDGELEKVTGNAMMLAKTFDSDINEVTRAAQNLITGFGIDADKAFDLMATGAQKGLNFSNEMFDNLAEYVPLWSQMGYSAEEMFGILERGAQVGVYNLDFMNDAMKEFQIKLKDGSKSTSDAFDQLSPKSQEVWKSFLVGKSTVADVASTVVNELKNMDNQVLANQIGVSLFGTKWEDLESKAMYAMLGTRDAMTDFEGAMDSVNQIQFSSFNSAVRGIGRILFMDLVYPIGDYLLPYLNQFANFLSNNFPSAIEKAKSLLKEYGPIALTVVGAFLTFQGVIKAVSTYQKSYNAIQGLTTNLLYAQRTAMMASTFAGGGLKGMLTGLRSGLAALNLTLLANPFILVAGAIIALGAAFYLLYQKSETFRTAVEPLVAMVKTQFVAMGQQIMAAFSQMSPLISKAVAQIVPILTNLAMTIIPLILTAVQMVFPIVLQIIQTVLPVAITLFQTIITVVLNLIQSVLPLLLTVVQTIFPLVLNIIQTIIPIITTILDALVMIIQNVVVPAINGILTVVQYVFPYVQMLIQNALAIINGIIQTAMALLRGDWDGAWEAIKSTAETIMNNIISFFQSINLFEIGKNIINGLINGITSMGGEVLNAISGLVPEPLRNAASGLMQKLGIGGYADGGIITRPELAWVGEGGDTEAIIPWNNSQRSKNLWIQTGHALGMLNKNGALSNMQQQIAMRSNSAPGIFPEDVSRATINRNSSQIIIQYNPQYNVNNPEDLREVQEYAERDKDDLLSRLAEIQRNERRLAFG